MSELKSINIKNPIPSLRFEGGEHTAIGDDTQLRFVQGEPSIPGANVELHLPNGLALTYGQIISLGGDFYGIPGQPISDGASAADRVQRFSAAFSSLATLPASRAEAGQILAVMQRDQCSQAGHQGRQTTARGL